MQKEEEELKVLDSSKNKKSGSHLTRTEWKYRIDGIKTLEQQIKEIQEESAELDQQLAEHEKKKAEDVQATQSEPQKLAENESFVSAVSTADDGGGDVEMAADDIVDGLQPVTEPKSFNINTFSLDFDDIETLN